MLKIIAGTSLLLCHVLVMAQGSFQDRGREAYEGMTPTERAAVVNGVLSGGQINMPITPMAKSYGSGQEGGLLFLKGLKCNEWNRTAPEVRANWLNQYYDTVSVRPGYTSPNRSKMMEETNSFCSQNPPEGIESAFAYAYRQWEAYLVQERADQQRRAEENRKRAQIDRELFMRDPANNPLMNGKGERTPCFDLKVRGLGYERWINQYTSEALGKPSNLDDNSRDRLTYLCESYPSLPIKMVVDYIFGINSAEVSDTTGSGAMVTWARRYQRQPLRLSIATIDGAKVEATTTKLKPGFHSIRYICEGDSDPTAYTGVFDIYVSQSDEQYLLTVGLRYQSEQRSVTTINTDSYDGLYRQDEYGNGRRTCNVFPRRCVGSLAVEKGKLRCLSTKPTGWFTGVDLVFP